MEASDCNAKLVNTLSYWVKHFTWDVNGMFTDADVEIIIGGITDGNTEKLKEIVDLNIISGEIILSLVKKVLQIFTDVFTIEELEWSIEPIKDDYGDDDFEIHIGVGVHLAEPDDDMIFINKSYVTAKLG